MAAARLRGGPVPTAKPRSDAYTGMLLLSLLAMIGGIVLLFLDYSQYPDTKPPLPGARPAAAAPAPAGAGAGGTPGVPAAGAAGAAGGVGAAGGAGAVGGAGAGGGAPVGGQGAAGAAGGGPKPQ